MVKLTKKRKTKKEESEKVEVEEPIAEKVAEKKEPAAKSGTSMKVDKKVVKEAEKLLKEMLELFEIEAETNVESGSYENAEGDSEEFVKITIDGEDLGVLIGYMGRNLRAFQKVYGMLLNKRLNESTKDDDMFVRVVIDVSGYRENRTQSLEKMAARIRDEVLASGEPTELPAMTSYERRVIHTCLSEYDDVTTESFGEGRDRYVRVFPTEGSAK